MSGSSRKKKEEVKSILNELGGKVEKEALDLKSLNKTNITRFSEIMRSKIPKI